jgi:hypothetical protein
VSVAVTTVPGSLVVDVDACDATGGSTMAMAVASLTTCEPAKSASERDAIVTAGVVAGCTLAE